MKLCVVFGAVVPAEMFRVNRKHVSGAWSEQAKLRVVSRWDRLAWLEWTTQKFEYQSVSLPMCTCDYVRPGNTYEALASQKSGRLSGNMTVTSSM
jgi:hypothetical protein